jgi:hypothetical protein
LLDELVSVCLPQGVDKGFGQTLEMGVQKKIFPNRFCGLMGAYLRRFSYSGNVLSLLGGKKELRETVLTLKVSCSDPIFQFGETLGDLFDGLNTAECEIPLHYLLVEDSASWVPPHEVVGIFHTELGPGGSNLTRVFKGFNVLLFAEESDYQKLLTRKNGTLTEDIEEFREKLFPRINGMVLTIGRIPLFEEFLPGASRRVLSANGVVTDHDLDLTRGRNQEFVRCFDLIIDLDTQLNYGKIQNTDRHLIGRARRFANSAYLATIQNAAGHWVGRIAPDQEDEFDDFMGRNDLGLEGFSIQKIPKDENDVIALFFELAGQGHFAEYKFFGLSQSDKYDSRAIIQRPGDKESPPTPEDDRHALVVEFKVKAASIIQDLDRRSKIASEIALIIAWEEGNSTSAHFGFANIEHSDLYPERVFSGPQRYLIDTQSGAQVQVLLLKEWISQHI